MNGNGDITYATPQLSKNAAKVILKSATAPSTIITTLSFHMSFNIHARYR